MICVGRLKEKYFIQACGEYLKRLSRDCDISVSEIEEIRLPQNPSRAEIDSALAKEAEQIRRRLRKGAFIAAMCVEGELFSSEKLAAEMERRALGGYTSSTFVIGGSYGLDAGLKKEADVMLSMSKMTFPHHLARVMLLEQIYRAFRIRAGSEYHK